MTEPKPWTPDQPLRPDATDENIGGRFTLQGAAALTAREFASVCASPSVREAVRGDFSYAEKEAAVWDCAKRIREGGTVRFCPLQTGAVNEKAPRGQSASSDG